MYFLSLLAVQELHGRSFWVTLNWLLGHAELPRREDTGHQSIDVLREGVVLIFKKFKLQNCEMRPRPQLATLSENPDYGAWIPHSSIMDVGRRQRGLRLSPSGPRPSGRDFSTRANAIGRPVRSQWAFTFRSNWLIKIHSKFSIRRWPAMRVKFLSPLANVFAVPDHLESKNIARLFGRTFYSKTVFFFFSLL